MQTFASWVPLPENQTARAAVERVVGSVVSGRPGPALNPLFLHGPSGTGKTHLASALAAAVTGQAPDRVVHLLPAGDFAPPAQTDEGRAAREAVRGADLVVAEDLQHLDARSADSFAGL